MSCPKGQIKRSSYTRKGHTRKSYTRKDGTRVRGSYVDRAKVPSGCVEDTGAPGKTPKSKQVLPKPGKEISLSRHGYSVHKSESKRHAALKKAAEKTKPLKVLRRLNLLANYQANDDAKETMREDVEFMKKVYAQHKMKEGRTSKRKSSRKGSKRRSRKSSRAKRSRKGSKKGSNKKRSGSKKRRSRK